MTEVPSEILSKMERFCAFQERCENDVRRKLASFSLSERQVEALVKELVDGRFLDENRYVETFVRSKVKAGWGKHKVMATLQKKGIPNELIRRHCDGIPDQEYLSMLQSAMAKWRRSHPGEDLKSPKLIRHLLSKGYLYGEIMETLSR